MGNVDAMEPAQPNAAGDAALGEIFDSISINRAQAASKAIGYLEKVLSINAVPESTRLILTGAIVALAVLAQRSRK